MPVDVFPDLTAPTVTVITEAHGMAPIEAELQITFPLETALNGAAHVRRVRSSTTVGISVVWIEFDWGTDIRQARRIVSEKLDLVSGQLPPSAEKPVMAPVSSIMGEIMFLSLTSERHSAIEIRTLAETTLRRRLLAVAGVSQVTPIGGDVKQYQVVASPERLQAYGITLTRLINVLTDANENVSAGVINQHGSEWLVTGIGRIQSLEDIRNVVLSERNGVPVLVKDIAQVQIGAAPKRGDASANAKSAVVLGIQKQPQANTIVLTKRLDRVLDDIESQLPTGMKLNRRIFRQSDFIEVAIRNVEHALRDGGLLVVIVVLLFLANLRATLITLTAIPLSLLTTILALQGMGFTINTMTLGGMAIAIGALVDDAIIDVENVFRRLRENHHLPYNDRQSNLRVVFNASVEIRKSIVFATLIIVLVFIPIFFLAGVEGRLLQPLGLAYVVALLASLLVAVTVTPVLCYFLLPGSRAVREETEPVFAAWLKQRYKRLLPWIIDHPWAVTVPTVLIFTAAIISTSRMGRAFLPEFNEGALTISAVTLPGTALAESNQLGRVVEEILLSYPEVVSVARRTGRAELDEHAMGVESAELDVNLKMQSRTKAEFLEALRGSLSVVPGMNITIGQPISHRIDHMLSGTRANIAVKIFGPDLYELRRVAEQVRTAMESVSGVVDLSVEQQADVPTIKVQFLRPAMAQYGLTIHEVARHLEAAIRGVEVSRILEGQSTYNLVVRLTESKQWEWERMGELMIDTPSGVKVPLKTVASLRKTTGPNTISREQVERKIVVQCNVSDRDVTSVVQDCQKLVNPIIMVKADYRVEYGGQFESAAEAGRILTILGITVIIGIGFLLHLAFGSARDAALTMINLPLALIGGIFGVFVSGGVLSVASLIGFITVFGIATRNGIMLISHIRHLQQFEGVDSFREAVLRGTLERLNPILMTAMATGLALVPLALGGGKPGTEIQTPMAIIILFGLLTSMLLNMVIVPALYFRLGKRVTKSSEQTCEL